MSGRYDNNFGYQDDRVVTEGDAAFMGVNEKLDPATLPVGICRGAINKRFNGGKAEDRGGILTPIAANAENYGRLYGSGVFSDPNGLEALLLVAANRVWQLQDGSYPSSIPLDNGETVDAPADPVQAFDRVILFRGKPKPPLEWNPATSSAFVGISQSSSGDGTEPIPNADTGTVYDNRMMVPRGKDEVDVSDILDYTRYVPTLESFRINDGSDDSLVRIFGYSQARVVMFKDQSIYMVSGVTGDLSGVQLDPINRQRGCIARRSPSMMGADIVFLSDNGVYTLSQVFEERLATGAVALSDPIEPTINRINWAYASQAVGIVFGDRYLLAVPLDDSAVNNALLVYNRINQQWEGVTQWDPAAGVQIDNMHLFNYLGKKRLHAVNYAAGKVYVLEEGLEDSIDGVIYPIVSQLKTRGYALQELSPKMAVRAAVAMGTWDPEYSLSVETEGVNESYPLVINKTKNRLKSYLHGVVDYDPSNDNDDHATPKREDYSMALDGPDIQLDNRGIDFDMKQEALERHTVRKTGRWISLVIDNQRGACDVRGVSLEHKSANRSTKVAA